MRAKYIEERYSPWMVFPEPWVTNATESVDVKMSSLEDAEKLVAAHNEVLAVLIRCALAFDEAAPDAFSTFWYGSELDPRREKAADGQ